jgi:hypothetical protein
MRCGIEKVFGWWKRYAAYQRVRHMGRESNRLELEFRCLRWNLKWLVSLTGA